MGNTAYCDCAGSNRDPGQIRIGKVQPNSDLIVGSLLNTMSTNSPQSKNRQQDKPQVKTKEQQDYENGGYFKGQMLGAQKNGYGELRIPIPSVSYSGNWQNDLPHGSGNQTINGHTYEGQFFEGMRQGRGTLVLPNGDKYQGDFYQNKPRGQGRLTPVGKQNSQPKTFKEDEIQLYEVR